MHPAASVILFTTLSGAGYGALVWLGLALAWRPESIAARSGAVALGVAMALAVCGLLSSLAHLGQPTRAWRAFSQWRSSWLSREGIAASACLVPAFALAVLLLRGAAAPELVRALGAAIALLGVATVFCTARIYTSLKTIAAWRHGLVLPAYLVFAGWSGLLLLWLLAIVLAQPMPPALLALAALLTLAALALKLAYWRAIDAARAVDAGRATGLGALGDVRAFEAPHTEENYLLREMGYRVARKHAARLRAIACGALLAVLALLLVAFGAPAAGAVACMLAVAGAALALALERWLFFAQATHVVTAYYGERGR